MLRYNAGSGNGPFGLAWSYEPMSIQRETQKGLPTYGASDVFISQGEELVSLSDGSYRTKNESSFSRVTRSGDGWAVTEKNGKVHLLGISPQSRISQPATNNFSSTFKWCEEQVLDTHSNRMQFTYATYLDSTGQVYCTGIQYSLVGGNSQSVVFDFEPRPDSFSSFLSGFEVKTGRRCQEIRVVLERRLGAALRARLRCLDQRPDRVRVRDRCRAGVFSPAPGDAIRQSECERCPAYLPPLQFGYTRFDAAAGVHGYAQQPAAVFPRQCQHGHCGHQLRFAAGPALYRPPQRPAHGLLQPGQSAVFS